MGAIDSAEPIEGPARLAGVTRRQCVDQRVDRRGLCTVDEEVELLAGPDVAKPSAQQGIQPAVGRGDQNGSGVLLPAMMHRRLGGKTERIGP